jgi:hypothetical protein
MEQGRRKVKNTVLSIYKAIEEMNAEELDSHFSRSEDLFAYEQNWTSRHKNLDQIIEKYQARVSEYEVHHEVSQDIGSGSGSSGAVQGTP